MSEQTPTISVIMPIYKVAKYLRRCLESIKKQTYTDFEVLMIDDGSPDESGSICIEYQQNDSRFHYYRKANGGAASARNYGLSLAQGKYFAFIDSDDFLGKDYLKLLYDQVVNNHCDIAIISYYMLDEKGNFFSR
jgi:glycosyltransferase involved in cell wall biosynthesis